MEKIGRTNGKAKQGDKKRKVSTRGAEAKHPRTRGDGNILRENRQEVWHPRVDRPEHRAARGRAQSCPDRATAAQDERAALEQDLALRLHLDVEGRPCHEGA